MNNVNRAHKIGPRTSITNRKHSRQVIIQFKDYECKTTFMKAMKQLRVKQANKFVSEDLTQKRARLLYLCREKIRKHQLLDCWHNCYQGNERQNLNDQLTVKGHVWAYDIPL